MGSHKTRVTVVASYDDVTVTALSSKDTGKARRKPVLKLSVRRSMVKWVLSASLFPFLAALGIHFFRH